MIETADNTKIYNINYKIQFSETDINSRIRIGAIINLLIQSSVKASEKLGFGVKDVDKQNLFWVLSGVDIHFEKEIKWKDKISIETWPKTLDKILYIRDFIIKNENGTILARATSKWLVLDKTNKRPKLINNMDDQYFDDTRHRNAIENNRIKIPEINEGDLFYYKTRYFDLDFNKHVGSARYADWIMDTFDIDFHINNYPRKIKINFHRETVSEEKITIIRQKTGAKEYIISGKRTEENTKCFSAKLAF